MEKWDEFNKCVTPKLLKQIRSAPKKYEVYLIRHVFDYAHDPDCEVWHKDFAGETMAISPEQACNNIRHRNGNEPSYYMDEYCEMWYEAEEVKTNDNRKM